MATIENTQLFTIDTAIEPKIIYENQCMYELTNDSGYNIEVELEKNKYNPSEFTIIKIRLIVPGESNVRTAHGSIINSNVSIRLQYNRSTIGTSVIYDTTKVTQIIIEFNGVTSLDKCLTFENMIITVGTVKYIVSLNGATPDSAYCQLNDGFNLKGFKKTNQISIEKVSTGGRRRIPRRNTHVKYVVVIVVLADANCIKLAIRYLVW